MNINLINSTQSLSPNRLQTLSKNNFAQGINFSTFITENLNSGSLRLIPEDYLNLNFNTYDGGMKISDLRSSTYLKSGKYIYSLSGSGFSNVVQNYPIDDTLLPQYQNNVIPSVFFNNFSTMIITGYNASLPISIFFLESGPLNSNQKTIQSFYNTGCYIYFKMTIGDIKHKFFFWESRWFKYIKERVDGGIFTDNDINMKQRVWSGVYNLKPTKKTIFFNYY